MKHPWIFYILYQREKECFSLSIKLLLTKYVHRYIGYKQTCRNEGLSFAASLSHREFINIEMRVKYTWTKDGSAFEWNLRIDVMRTRRPSLSKDERCLFCEIPRYFARVAKRPPNKPQTRRRLTSSSRNSESRSEIASHFR